MKDIIKLIKEILDKGYLMSLATLDSGGIWVSDVIYVYDNKFNIWWMSKTFRRHSKAILENSQVAGSITITQKPGEPDLGLQIEGKAEKIKGDNLEIAKKHRKKRNKPLPKKDGEVFDVPEDSWYKLTPSKIELIHEPLFGHNKQILTF